ncbi:MAG: hypothetical protein H6669_17635 [Ardenticatenaceae bacterium]|nr:hypothetical protein [Ardenticatenaceae bacterium]
MIYVTLSFVGLLLLQNAYHHHALRLPTRHASAYRLGKVPGLASRPISDMAQRSHVIYKMRDLPNLTTAFLRNVFTLILTVVGIIWLSPEIWLGWLYWPERWRWASGFLSCPYMNGALICVCKPTWAVCCFFDSVAGAGSHPGTWGRAGGTTEHEGLASGGGGRR